MVRLISWNVLAGGGRRCGAIVRRLRRYDADIIVLQETMPSRSAELCGTLGRAGYMHHIAAPSVGDRGLCLLSRLPLCPVRGPAPPHARVWPRGWLEVELVDSGARVAAVYGPAAGPPLPAFWDAAAAWLDRRARRPFIMLGDFNAGASHRDAEGYRFKAGRGFAALTRTGLIDLWRRQHGDRTEHTWYSTPGGGRTPRGFRIDHAFASPSLAERVTGCRYDHDVRRRRWSDHSLLVVDVAVPSLPRHGSPPNRGEST
ncbi:MAG: exodeoxyribonuclease III [Gemmatimonadales bacterium]